MVLRTGVRKMNDAKTDDRSNGEDLNTTQAVFRALEELGGEREEAPVGNVINRVVVNHERPLGDVLEELTPEDGYRVERHDRLWCIDPVDTGGDA